MADPEKQSEQPKAVQQKMVIGKFKHVLLVFCAALIRIAMKKSAENEGHSHRVPPPVMASMLAA
jgi:hypothetical protein